MSEMVEKLRAAADAIEGGHMIWIALLIVYAVGFHGMLWLGLSEARTNANAKAIGHLATLEEILVVAALWPWVLAKAIATRARRQQADDKGK